MGHRDSPLVLVSLGADPELFLRDHKTKEPVPSIGYIKGTKHNPEPVEKLGQGFAIQEDNVMVEFNIPPCHNQIDFDKSIGMMLKYLEKYFIKMNYDLDISASMLFKPEQLNHPQAQVMGCDPDYDAWHRRQNPPPDEEIARKGLRSAGGHIHVGVERFDGDDLTGRDRELLVRAMDICLGIPAFFVDPDNRRKELYGRPGAFRPKSYGVEYRTLSNFWINSSENRKWVWKATEKAVELVHLIPDLLTGPLNNLSDAMAKNNKPLLLHMYSMIGKSPIPPGFAEITKPATISKNIKSKNPDNILF